AARERKFTRRKLQAADILEIFAAVIRPHREAVFGAPQQPPGIALAFQIVVNHSLPLFTRNGRKFIKKRAARLVHTCLSVGLANSRRFQSSIQTARRRATWDG